MAERRYNENELAEILRAAAEAQSKAPGISEESSGYSLAEIERLAAEVGIDPKHINSAAQGLSQVPQAKKGMKLFGGPDRHVFERTIEGTLDDIGWEDAVSELRTIFEGTGTTSMVGTSREWVGGTDFRNVHVASTPRNGRTKILVTINRRDMMAVGWLAVIMTSLFTTIAAAVNLGRHESIFIVAPIVMMLLGTVYFLVQRMLDKAHAKDTEAVDRFMNRVQELVPSEQSNLSKNLADQTATKSIQPQQSNTVT